MAKDFTEAKKWVLETLASGGDSREIFIHGSKKFPEQDIASILNNYPDNKKLEKIGRTGKIILICSLGPIVFSVFALLISVLTLPDSAELAKAGLAQMIRGGIWYVFLKDLLIGHRRSFVFAIFFAIVSLPQGIYFFGVGLVGASPDKVDYLVQGGLVTLASLYAAIASIWVLRKVWQKVEYAEK